MGRHSILAIKFIIIMTVLTGVIYVLFITGIAQLFFPAKANGSLIVSGGRILGSELIGQKFDSSKYFWSRPSFISYNPIPSGASNYGPTSDTLKKQVNARRRSFIAINSLPDTVSIPKEMISASGSGLDPHVSPAAARAQVDRIIKSRRFSGSQRKTVLELITKLSEKPQFSLLGEPRINVLLLNLALDSIR